VPALLPTIALAVGALGITFVPDARTASWRGGVLMDDSVRSAFRADTASGRRGAATVSDVLMWSSVGAPFLASSLISGFGGGGGSSAGGALGDEAGRVAGTFEPQWRSVQWAANAYFVSHILTQSTKKIVARERPYARECRESGVCDNEYSPTASFFSGHASASFTGAGLLCSTRFQREAGISAAAAPWVCGGGVTFAASTGVLRWVADKHYATDVLVGSAVGFASGYWLAGLFFSGEDVGASAGAAASGARVSAFAPMVTVDGGRGLSLSIAF
jgi:hypothetical protein